jgi:hypothetical protein
MEISHYPKYLWVNNQVVTKDRKFPLTPRAGKTPEFFLEDCNGNTRFVSTRELKKFIIERRLEKSKSKGRLVKHVSGKVFGSIKEAREATGLSDAKLKGHPDYTIA